MVRNERLIAMRFPDKLVNELDQIARLDDMNRSSLLRKLARDHINDFKKIGIQDDVNGILEKLGRLVRK